MIRSSSCSFARRLVSSTLAPLGCTLALALASGACGGNQPEPAAPSSPAASSTGTAAKGPVKEPGDAKVGETTKCPVSGEEFVVDANSPKVEYEGKTYYFCCGGCKKKFESDPSKFAKKS